MQIGRQIRSGERQRLHGSCVGGFDQIPRWSILFIDKFDFNNELNYFYTICVFDLHEISGHRRVTVIRHRMILISIDWNCNFVGLLHHPFWLHLVLALLGQYFLLLEPLCLAKDHWWGLITRNAHMVHIVNKIRFKNGVYFLVEVSFLFF